MQMQRSTNGNLAGGYFPAAPTMTIGTIVVLAVVGYYAYKALKKK